MEANAEIVSDTQVDAIVAEEPPAVQDEILAIYREARDRALQVALVIPLAAALVGVFNGFRMVRPPDIEPSSDIEGMDWA